MIVTKGDLKISPRDIRVGDKIRVEFELEIDSINRDGFEAAKGINLLSFTGWIRDDEKKDPYDKIALVTVPERVIVNVKP